MRYYLTFTPKAFQKLIDYQLSTNKAYQNVQDQQSRSMDDFVFVGGYNYDPAQYQHSDRTYQTLLPQPSHYFNYTECSASMCTRKSLRSLLRLDTIFVRRLLEQRSARAYFPVALPCRSSHNRNIPYHQYSTIELETNLRRKMFKYSISLLGTHFFNWSVSHHTPLRYAAHHTHTVIIEYYFRWVPFQ